MAENENEDVVLLKDRTSVASQETETDSFSPLGLSSLRRSTSMESDMSVRTRGPSTWDAYDSQLDQGTPPKPPTPPQNHKRKHKIHPLTDVQVKKLESFENTEYLMEDNMPYWKWVNSRNPDPTVQWDRWLMMFYIGVATGLVGFALLKLTEFLSEFKYDLARELLQEEKHWEAFAWYAGCSCMMTFIAGAMIVPIPSAAGGGVPEVISHLNGTVVPDIFTTKFFFAKFFSCAIAVASGVFMGPEGPMIALGATVGRAVSGMSNSPLRIKLPFFLRLRNPKDRRDFVAAGAGAGVASAFGSPIGGLLFSMEEVSSFWSHMMTWQTLFCCMLAAFTTNVLKAWDEGELGQMGGFIFRATTTDLHYNVLLCVPAMILGVIGGLLGPLFSICNLKLLKLRGKYFKSPWHRVAEVVLIAFITSAFVIFSPSLFNCRPCDVQDGNPTTCFENDSDTQRYTCQANEEYNDMASLTLSSGHNTLLRLFARESYKELTLFSLGLMLVFYFPMAVWTAGTIMSGGIVIPMLMIGALYGRMLGLIMVFLFGPTPSGAIDWMDPGLLALIGSASFFGGVSRLTVSLTMIMVELSSDVQLLVPLVITIIIAKNLADRFTAPVYHGLIEAKCIPFLGHHPKHHSFKSLDLYPVEALICNQKLVTMEDCESVKNVIAKLRSCRHNKFPLVERGTLCFIGSVRRDTIVLLLLREVFEEKAIPVGKKRRPWDHDEPGVFFEDQIATNSRQEKHVNWEQLLTEKGHLFLNLRPYMDRSAATIMTTFSVSRTYDLFRTMGYRHIFVLNKRGEPVGVVTKRDLMDYSVMNALVNAQPRA